MLRFLMVEAGQVTVRSLPEWRIKYFQLMMRRGRKIAKVAMARRLAIGLYWMWRKGWDYEQVKKFGSHAGQLGPGSGVQYSQEPLKEKEYPARHCRIRCSRGACHPALSPNL